MLSLAWSVAALAVPVDIPQYLSLRKKHGPVSASVCREQPSAASGKVVEIRGKLTGTSRNGERGCMIVSTETDGSFVIDTAELPSDSPGTQLACLVRFDGGEGLRQVMELLAWTYDADLRRAEQAASARPAQAATPTPRAQAAKVVQPKTAQTAQTPKPRASETRPLTEAEYVAIYRKAIKSFNKRLSDAEAETIARSVLGFSIRYKVDARLVCAVILAESHFRMEATSSCGAMGLGQLMPGTAAGLGVNNPYDPVENVYGSVRYIRSMLDRMAGGKQWNDLTWNDLALALAAYNAGPGAVKKHGGVPPYKETQNYVKKVTAIYKQLCGVSS